MFDSDRWMCYMFDTLIENFIRFVRLDLKILYDLVWFCFIIVVEANGRDQAHLVAHRIVLKNSIR